jgi:hypothetical protein
MPRLLLAEWIIAPPWPKILNIKPQLQASIKRVAREDFEASTMAVDFER